MPRELPSRSVRAPAAIAILFLLLSGCGDASAVDDAGADTAAPFDGGPGVVPSGPDILPRDCVPRSLLVVYDPLGMSTDDPSHPLAAVPLEVDGEPVFVSAGLRFSDATGAIAILSVGSDLYRLTPGYELGFFGEAKDLAGNLVSPDALFDGVLTGGLFGAEMRLFTAAQGQFGSPFTPYRNDIEDVPPFPFRPRNILYVEIPPFAFLVAVTGTGEILSADATSSRDVFGMSYVVNRLHGATPKTAPLSIQQLFRFETEFGAIDEGRVIYQANFENSPIVDFDLVVHLEADPRVGAHPPRAVVYQPTIHRLLVVEDLPCE